MPPNMIIIYIIMSVAVIGVLLALYIKCKGKEKFCTCHGMDRLIASNPSATQQAYRDGLTENSLFIRGTPYDYTAPETQFHLYPKDSQKPGCCS